MRRLIVFVAIVAASAPQAAAAQAALAQGTPSPWSLFEAIDAPDALKPAGSTRVRFETIEGQPRAGFNARDTLVNLRTTLFAEYDAGPVRFTAELWDSRVYGVTDARR